MGGDLHSDPGILLIFFELPLCKNKIALIYCCFARSYHYHADDFSDEPDFIQ